jgi:crossover junction endodeoxyribonuclease RuvC
MSYSPTPSPTQTPPQTTAAAAPATIAARTSTPFPPSAAAPRQFANSGSSPILGVDPGITGGIAFLFANRVVAEDIPTAGGEVDVDTLVRRIREMQPALAIIERANAMPKQGVASTFKYGVAYGALRTTVALCNIPYRLVTPGKWKAHFHLDADKEKSRALAIQLWPGCGYFALKKHHGRAEAALIARYGAETIATNFVAPSDKCKGRPLLRGHVS